MLRICLGANPDRDPIIPATSQRRSRAERQAADLRVTYPDAHVVDLPEWLFKDAAPIPVPEPEQLHASV